MDDSSCRKFIVTGRVQGVWFRASTRDQALRLGIHGYARNLPDGSVEVVACGKKDTVQTLYLWLWQGPPQARVDAVKELQCDQKAPSEFVIE